MAEHQDADYERMLQGRTLVVYLYLQRKKEPSGIREVQRELGLSSPSVADYQIEKLVEMGLAARDEYGRVHVTRHVRVKALQSYVSLGQFMIPRLAFYATIFTAVSIIYLVFNPTTSGLIGAAVPAAAAGIFWFEGVKMWRVRLVTKVRAKKGAVDNRDFWVSLAPGMAALAVFIVASIFLFYVIQPGRPAPESFPVDTEHIQTPTAAAADDVLRLDALQGASSHSEIVANFPVSLMPGLFLGGGLVAGFLVYVMLRYRCLDDVPMLEQQPPAQF